MPQRKSRQNADRMVCEVSQSHACPFTLLDELDSIPDDIPCEFILVQPRVAILGLFTEVPGQLPALVRPPLIPQALEDMHDGNHLIRFGGFGGHSDDGQVLSEI